MKMKEDLLKLKNEDYRFTVILDEWTSGINQRFLNVNVHTVINCQPTYWNIGLARIFGSMSSESCVQVLKEKLSEFDLSLDKDIVGITTDGASVMKKTVQSNPEEEFEDPELNTNRSAEEKEVLGDNPDNYDGLYFSLPIRQVYLATEYQMIISKLRKCVKLFKNSPTKNDMLQIYIQQEFGKTIQLVLDCKTRWSSLCNMISTYNSVKQCVAKTLVDLSLSSNPEYFFTDEEHAVLIDLENTLQPVKLAVEMREWLSRREWCDARLVCRGRVFCAHRAVLASVSPYLRFLLKSHSEEDTPTYLVLPDFDLDAMSAVLHYIYNGEVSLPTNRVNSFFDVITTLQIFVDLKSLLNVKAKLEDIHTKYANETLLDIETVDNMECYSSITKNKYEKDLLKLETKINYLIKRNVMVNGKKDEWVPCEDIIDKEIRSRHPTRNELRSRKQRLSVHGENVQVQDGYQEKSSPLRDPPVDLYPRSGETNGPPAPAAVPAIANEGHRDARSMRAACELITDAVLIRDGENNCARSAKNFSVSNNDFSKTLDTRNTSTRPRNNIINPFEIKENNVRLRREMCSLNKLCNRLPDTEDKGGEVRRPNPLRPVPTLLPISLYDKRSFVRQLPPLLDLTSVHLLPTSLHPAYRENWSPSIQKNESMFEGDLQNKKDYTKECSEDDKIRLGRNFFEGHIKDSDAVPIQKKSAFNQVMASPWCPRVPNCYRPQPNKIIKDSPPRFSIESQAQIESKNEEDKSPSNDRNNNVRTPQSPRDRSQEPDTCLETNPHSVTVIMREDEFKCGVCDKVFSSSEGLSAHARAHTASTGAGARHTCSECGKTFSQLRNYKYHVSVHRGTREFAATCSVCGKYFNDRGYLSSHMKIHRNRKEYECPHCPKSFNQRVAYNMHVRIHTGSRAKSKQVPMSSRVHIDELRGCRFSSCVRYNFYRARSRLARAHRRSRSRTRTAGEIEPWNRAVQNLNTRYSEFMAGVVHTHSALKFIHNGVKPHVCSECGKAFSRKMLLKQHQRTHSGERPYACSVCDKRFADRSNMTLHMRLHSVRVRESQTRNIAYVYCYNRFVGSAQENWIIRGSVCRPRPFRLSAVAGAERTGPPAAALAFDRTSFGAGVLHGLTDSVRQTAALYDTAASAAASARPVAVGLLIRLGGPARRLFSNL
ncbi:Putative uncharacterized zinc finger protein 814 [Eumeta japonica]|uniref:Uncharacterized zinc finger protein 814 n=1 Tax=Eumeta variegata TaxID=151549 RepID=A0A4C1WX28_EUMVA|nr:Putative uncharacterized zinc finger protein 814 [Eumeta japonica]